jgi:hypothetical protein
MKWLVVYKGIISVCYENQMKVINTLSEQNAELLAVKSK